MSRLPHEVITMVHISKNILTAILLSLSIGLLAGCTQTPKENFSAVRNSAGTDAVAPRDSGGPVFTQMNGKYVIHGTLSASGNINGSLSPVNCFYSAPIYYAELAGFDFELN